MKETTGWKDFNFGQSEIGFNIVEIASDDLWMSDGISTCLVDKGIEDVKSTYLILVSFLARLYSTHPFVRPPIKLSRGSRRSTTSKFSTNALASISAANMASNSCSQILTTFSPSSRSRFSLCRVSASNSEAVCSELGISMESRFLKQTGHP